VRAQDVAIQRATARVDKTVVRARLAEHPHTWRLKRIGLRSRLVSNGWGLSGPHAEKVIAGRRVLITTIGEQSDWVICRFERRPGERAT
jgi:hypothetical protein